MERGKSRRLSAIIKSVAAESGVGHLVGVAERGSGMGVKIQELTGRVDALGLSHLIKRKKGMSMSDEIRMLNAIIHENETVEQPTQLQAQPTTLLAIIESDTESDGDNITSESSASKSHKMGRGRGLGAEIHSPSKLADGVSDGSVPTVNHETSFADFVPYRNTATVSTDMTDLHSGLDYDSLNAKVRNLEDNYCSLEAKLAISNEVCSSQEEVIARQKDLLDEYNVSVVNSEQEIASLNEKLWVAQREIQQLKYDLSRAENTINTHKEQFVEIELSLRSKEKENQELMLKLDDMSNVVHVDSVFPQQNHVSDFFTQTCRDNKALLKQLVFEINEKLHLRNIVRLLLADLEKKGKPISSEGESSDHLQQWQVMNLSQQLTGWDVSCQLESRTLTSIPENYRVVLDPFDPVPLLGHSEQYLKDAIRRMRIGWVLQKMSAAGKYEELIFQFNMSRREIHMALLGDQNAMQRQLFLTISCADILNISKTADIGTTLSQSSSPCLSIEHTRGDSEILLFIAHDERDLFYDALVCVVTQIEPVFKRKFLKCLSPEDITASRYLKSKVVKNLSGEYVFVTFNRRSLLSKHSSISALQSAGFFSDNEASLTDMLNICSTKSTSPLIPVRAADLSGSMTYQNSQSENLLATPNHPDEQLSRTNGVLDDFIEMHSVYSSTRDFDRGFLFSMSSSTNRSVKSFTMQNPATSYSSENQDKITRRSVSKRSGEKQRRQSAGEDNVIRMGAYFTNRKCMGKYEDTLQRKDIMASPTSNSDDIVSKQVRVDLDAPGRNRIPLRRGSASAILAQQTAKFLLNASGNTAAEV